MACGDKEQATVLVKDADYKSAQGKAIELDFCAVTGFTPGVCTGKLGFSDGTNSLIIIGGAVSDNGDGTWKVQFDIDQADTTALPVGRYDWQVEISEGSEEVTVGRSSSQREQVEWQSKLT